MNKKKQFFFLDGNVPLWAQSASAAAGLCKS